MQAVAERQTKPLSLHPGGTGQDDYRSILGIYWDRLLKPKRPFGIGKGKCPNRGSQFAVCFSEIPPGRWARLGEKRETKYGIGFTKEFVLHRGGGPIWYVWKDTPHWRVLQQIMVKEAGNPAAEIWKLTPLIDAPGVYTSGPYFFEWEREWRHIGPFAFEPEDVAFLLIPEGLHRAATTVFERVRYENTGPSYLCPYVDPTWGRTRILSALRKR